MKALTIGPTTSPRSPSEPKDARARARGGRARLGRPAPAAATEIPDEPIATQRRSTRATSRRSTVSASDSGAGQPSGRARHERPTLRDQPVRSDARVPGADEAERRRRRRSRSPIAEAERPSSPDPISGIRVWVEPGRCRRRSRTEPPPARSSSTLPGAGPDGSPTAARRAAPAPAEIRSGRPARHQITPADGRDVDPDRRRDRDRHPPVGQRRRSRRRSPGPTIWPDISAVCRSPCRLLAAAPPWRSRTRTSRSCWSAPVAQPIRPEATIATGRTSPRRRAGPPRARARRPAAVSATVGVDRVRAVPPAGP